MSRQDRQGVRRPAELEQKYDFEKRFGDAMEAANAASDAVNNLDKVLDQNEVLNRLTNNGNAKAIYIDENGQLYINASYLTSGVLKSKNGKTFYLDINKGILKGNFNEFTVNGKTVDAIASNNANAALDTARTYADNAAKGAVKNMSQKDAVNKLTNNGNAKGIYLAKGQIYIDAGYIERGVLQSADKSFSVDLASGEVKIAGKKVSWVEKDGDYVLVGE